MTQKSDASDRIDRFVKWGRDKSDLCRDGQREALKLLVNQGATLPFVARYRKDRTGGATAVQLEVLLQAYDTFAKVEDRKLTMLKNLEARGRGILTAKLRRSIETATSLRMLEDIWMPYRKTRCTRAEAARAKGLEPLAKRIFDAPHKVLGGDDKMLLRREREGLLHLLAQCFSECRAVREALRNMVQRFGVLRTTQKKSKVQHTKKASSLSKSGASVRKSRVGTFEMYHDWSCRLSRVKSHHVLAIERGAREKKLNVVVKIEHPCCLVSNRGKSDAITGKKRKTTRNGRTSTTKNTTAGHARLVRRVVRIIRQCARQSTESVGRKAANPPSHIDKLLDEAASDAWTRLIRPSIVRGARKKIRDEARAHAVECFASNVEGLLLQRPYGGKRVLGIDPGFRMGCKMAVVDAQGTVLEVGVAHLHRRDAFRQITTRLLRKHRVELVALGNGKASRETEELLGDVLRQEEQYLQSTKTARYAPPRYVVVDEAGVSVYSTSAKAREEFGDDDPLSIGSISIARRLQDPLSELVKVPPVSLGVGMYQHDLPEKSLIARLDRVVTGVVSEVGVDANTASVELLRRVAGLNARSAAKLHAAARARKFTCRDDMRRALTARAYEQCAGFLRICNSTCMLDDTNVHPESYGIARALLDAAGISKGSDRDIAAAAVSKLSASAVAAVARAHGSSVAAAEDVRAFLARPGRMSDPRLQRAHLPPRTGPLRMDDLRVGDSVRGCIKNRVTYGAFVDIGIETDALLHFSRVDNEDALALMSVGAHLDAIVVDIDRRRRRVALGITQSASGREHDTGSAASKKDTMARAKKRRRAGSGASRGCGGSRGGTSRRGSC